MIVAIRLPEGAKFDKKHRTIYIKTSDFSSCMTVGEFFSVVNAQTPKQFESCDNPASGYKSVRVNHKGKFTS